MLYRRFKTQERLVSDLRDDGRKKPVSKFSKTSLGSDYGSVDGSGTAEDDEDMDLFDENDVRAIANQR